MAPTAAELLENTTAELAPDPHANPLVPLIARGEAPRDTLATLALEQQWVIPADLTAFRHLARRAEPEAAAFFEMLAEGESTAQERLRPFASACGIDEARSRAYDPLPGCQAYPAYVSWLALNAAPSDTVLAITANFSAWGGYCARIARALRIHYGFKDEACAFFDLFAQPAPELDRAARAAVQAGLDAGTLSEERAHAYGRLLRSYEAMFWGTLSTLPALP